MFLVLEVVFFFLKLLQLCLLELQTICLISSVFKGGLGNNF